MPQLFLLDGNTVPVELAPTCHRPHVGGDIPFGGQHLGGSQRRGHCDPRSQDVGGVGAAFGGRPIPVDAPQQTFGVEVLRLRRLHIRFVVDGEVEEHVLRVYSVHAGQPAFDDVGDLEGEGGVVGDHRRIGGRQQQRVAVGVLQAFAGQRGAPRGRPEQEAPRHLVGGGPDAVAGALEPEHRIEDVNRDHRLVVRRIRRADRGERGDRSGLVDALVQDLAGGTFLVGQHQFGVDGGVELAVAVVDLQ